MAKLIDNQVLIRSKAGVSSSGLGSGSSSSFLDLL